MEMPRLLCSQHVLTMADANLFRAGIVQRYLIQNTILNCFGCPENAHFIGTVPMLHHLSMFSFLLSSFQNQRLYAAASHCVEAAPSISRCVAVYQNDEVLKTQGSASQPFRIIPKSRLRCGGVKSSRGGAGSCGPSNDGDPLSGPHSTGKRSGCQRATERCQPSARHGVQPVSGGLREPRLNQR